MKKYCLLIFILFSSFTYCQEGYSFESKIHPEKEYILQMNISSITETTIDKKVTKNESKTSITRTITTEKLNKEGLMPSSMRIGNLSVSGEGKESLNPISNTLLVGQVSVDNKFKIDTIYNNEINQKTRTALKYAFNDLKPDIDFPKKLLKMGESFENKTPLTVPFNNDQIKTLVTKKFTLNSVKNNIATFNVTEKIVLNSDSLIISASGEGSGILKFNIIENQIISETSHQTINIKVTNGDKTINGLVKLDSEKMTTINNIIIEEPPKTR